MKAIILMINLTEKANTFGQNKNNMTANGNMESLMVKERKYLKEEFTMMDFGKIANKIL